LATQKHGLTPTPRGWMKRINGRPRWIVSKTIAPTPEMADNYYQQHFGEFWSDDDEAGAKVDAEALTVAEIADMFFGRKEARRDSKLIGALSLGEYHQALKRFCEFAPLRGTTKLGERLPFDLSPADFGDFRNHLAERFGVDRRKKFMILIRSAFKWAAGAPLRLPLPHYGDEFNLPSRADFRKARKRTRESRGTPFFEPAEIVALTKSASPALKAMILLAINCGMGNTDLAELPMSVIDAGDGWLDYSRAKTGADRLSKLWPETIEAIAEYRKNRPEPADSSGAALLFLTRRGQPFVRIKEGEEGKATKKDQISVQFSKLVLACELRRRGFYDLRRTYRTIAAETGEERAINLTMGHASSAEDMGSIYTVAILRQKLEAIADHVHARIFKRPKTDASRSSSKRSRAAGGAASKKRRKPRRA
jgi:integrase